MKLVYLPGSFFAGEDAANRQMLRKLENWLALQDADMILVSADKDLKKETRELMVSQMRDIPVLVSPVHYEKGSVQFDLGDVLQIKGQTVTPFPDTAVIVDTRTGTWKRVYLELFPQVDTSHIGQAGNEINTEIDAFSKDGPGGLKS